jgi:hypothetical protein
MGAKSASVGFLVQPRHIPLATRQGRQDARSGRGPTSAVASREANQRPSYAQGRGHPQRGG